MKNFNFSVALFVCGFVAAATVYADLTTSEKEQYANANSSYDTFQVVRDYDCYNPFRLYAHELYNYAANHAQSESGTELGLKIYDENNAASFYAERAVKSFVSSWTVGEGSQIVGMYRSADSAHSVDFTNSTGTVWNTTVGQGQSFYSWGTWLQSLFYDPNIDVGDIGDINMNLTASWKTNAANNDPVWADGLEDVDKNDIRNQKDGIYGDYSTTVFGDRPELNGGLISMVAYDVTDLLKAMGYTDIENALMFTWEDWNWGTDAGKLNIDFDYNDMVYIMTNVTPNAIAATPEPATILIFGLAFAVAPFARRLRNRK